MQLKSPLTRWPLQTRVTYLHESADDKLPYFSNLKVTGQVSAEKAKKMISMNTDHSYHQRSSP